MKFNLSLVSNASVSYLLNKEDGRVMFIKQGWRSVSDTQREQHEEVRNWVNGHVISQEVVKEDSPTRKDQHADQE